MIRPLFTTKRDGLKPSSSSDSEDEHPSTAVPVSTSFRCARKEEKKIGGGNLFMIDRIGDETDAIEVDESESSDEEPEATANATSSNRSVEDKELDKVLAKAVVQPGFEQNYAQNTELLGRRRAKKLRAKEREKTTGSAWFDMPATEMTEERRRDLELLMMRGALDSKVFYRKNDRAVLPKYFQVGTVVDAPEDWYSSRMTRKERKRTMVDELLSDQDLMHKSKNKYDVIRKREKDGRKAFYRQSGRSKKPKAKKQ